jgi:hypothetical protein
MVYEKSNFEETLKENDINVECMHSIYNFFT